MILKTSQLILRSSSQYCLLALTLCLSAQLPVIAQSAASASSEPTTTSLQSGDVPAPLPEEFSSAISSSYLLGPGDQIALSVLGYPEYAGNKVVLPDGTISLDLVGSIMAAGETQDSLAQKLTASLREYLVDPVVTISLVSLRPVVVNVAGEVERPGPIQLLGLTATNFDPEATNPRSTRFTRERAPTVSSAIIAAGGVTTYADIRQIVLRRPLPGGESATTTINLWDAIWSDASPLDPVVQDGDTIFVPQATEGDQLDQRLLARSTLAPENVRVRVVGEVVEPGEVLVPPNSSLSSAIAIAGGPTEDARLSRVAYVRMNESGQIEREVVDLRNLTDEFQVQSGDVIIVPKSSTPEILDFAGRVFSPVNALINIFRGIGGLFGGN